MVFQCQVSTLLPSFVPFSAKRATAAHVNPLGKLDRQPWLAWNDIHPLTKTHHLLKTQKSIFLQKCEFHMQFFENVLCLPMLFDGPEPAQNCTNNSSPIIALGIFSSCQSVHGPSEKETKAYFIDDSGSLPHYLLKCSLGVSPLYANLL